ncbi:MAG: endo-1,4-beta-xylanase [Clostridia bacterium]|nr:endo-1,4-beta-xylanase [Clostridia bacterium]
MVNEAIADYRRRYEALLPRLNADIEKYRKGNFKIKIVKKDGTPVVAKVQAEQKKHLFDFGTSALMLGNMGDKEQAYRDAVSNLFNLVTTTFCWNVMETEPGKFRFEEGSEEIYRRPPSDRVLNFAKENDMKAKGQPLFCGRWCPDWVPKDLDELKRLWIHYVKEVAKRYDGEYGIFDVVNESYQSKGSWQNMRSWLPIPVDEFVKWMLETAGEIFSDRCVMERNEATHVNYGEHADRYYQENKKLLEEGVRLDSIGIQFHFYNGDSCMERLVSSSGIISLETIYATYQKMSTLGVPLYISEITIPSVYEGMTLDEGEEFQAELLESLYRLWFSIPNMRGIIYWNIKDGDAWGKQAECRGCLIDEYVRKKKSYYALEHLIKREWNTCVTSETDQDGVLEFSGFYGDYSITVIKEGAPHQKYNVSFDQTTDTFTVIV